MKYTLSKTVTDKLVKQLTSVEEKRLSLNKKLNSDSSHADIIEIMKQYSQKLSELIEYALHHESDDVSLPVVLVGCDVEVRDLDSNELINFYITTSDNFDTLYNNVTLLSPIGKELLFKKVGDTAEICIPSGIVRYCIESIKVNSEIDNECWFIQ